MFIRIVLLSALAGAALLVGFLKTHQSDATQSEVIVNAPLVSEIDAPKVDSASKSTNAQTPKQTLEAESLENDSGDAIQDEEWESINAAFEEVADQFEESIQYPTFSFPIATPEAVTKYIPNQGAEVGAEGEGYQFNLVTEQFLVSSAEPITGSVRASGISTKSVRITLMDSGQELAVIDVELVRGQVPFSFPPLGQSWQSDALLVVATIEHDKQELTVSSPIQKMDMSPSSSELHTASDSYVDGPWLRIPVSVSIKQEGYYRFEANLYSASTGQPLLHLLDEQEFSIGKSDFILSAHASALKKMRDEGDYLLKDLWLEQTPSPPDFENKPGIISTRSMRVTGFPFSEYSEEAYVDPEAQARLEFLQSISN